MNYDERESPHFLLRYNLRNPLNGKGYGAGGVRDDAMIDTYIAALERLYEVMTSPPWSRPPPIVGTEGKTIVKVLNIAELKKRANDPFTDADLNGVPYICLPCGNDEPTVEGERLRAIAEAVHEATHVFNWRERPLRDLNATADLHSNPKWWWWMHEAMALYMETVVLKDNDDFHRFLRHWVVLPEVPLDEWNPGYQAGTFLCYLDDMMGPEIINKIWTSSSPTEKPLQAIARVLMEEGCTFSSHSPDDADVFASGYCMSSYFLQDAGNARHVRNLFQRHGERAVSETFCLSMGDPQSAEDSLNHLACRYYRFFPDSRITKLEVNLLADGSRGPTTLKAELAVVTRDKQRGPVYKLRPASSSASAGGSMRLSAEINQLAPGDIDHIVLVVSNCGFGGMEQHPQYYDGKKYTITVKGH